MGKDRAHTNEGHYDRSHTRSSIEKDDNWIRFWIAQRFNEKVVQMSRAAYVVVAAVPVRAKIGRLLRERRPHFVQGVSRHSSGN